MTLNVVEPTGSNVAGANSKSVEGSGKDGYRLSRGILKGLVGRDYALLSGKKKVQEAQTECVEIRKTLSTCCLRSFPDQQHPLEQDASNGQNRYGNGKLQKQNDYY